MLNILLSWIVYPCTFLFLDMLFQNFFHQLFFYFMLILTIKSLWQSKSWIYSSYILTLFLLVASSLYTDHLFFITLLWIPLLLSAHYLQTAFSDQPLFPYILFSLCFFIKIIVFKLIFEIENSGLLYTTGQFIGNLLLLLTSLKWFSAVKASNRT